MSILLTGADGFTGRYFAEAARRKGLGIAPLKADLTDADAVAQEVASIAPSAVVHLGAISFVGHHDARAFYDVNLFGTENLLTALAALPAKPSRVVLASSANVYGNSLVSPISENQPPAPTNHYAMSKLAMEYMAANHHATLPVVIVRPFNYTGHGQNEAFLIPKLVGHFARKSPIIELGNLDVEREFNDVRFVCEAYLRLLEAGVPGQTYNVCSGKPMTIRTVLGVLARMTGHHPELRVNPEFVRANEVRSLSGDPARLASITGPLPEPSLEETLGWMLQSLAA